MKKYKIYPEVVFNEVEQELVIVSNKTSMITSLNETGSELFKLMADGFKTEAELSGYLTSHYEVTEDQARADVGELLGILLENDLVEAIALEESVNNG